LVIVEYGDEREKIIRFLAEKGYSMQDNGQDLIAACPQLEAIAKQEEVSDSSPQVVSGEPKKRIRYGALEITTVIGCRIACTHCPQSALVRAYNARGGQRVMSFETFKRCIDKVPAEVRLGFCGMAEPWLNPDCTKMIQYAVAKGHEIDVFSTLSGMKESDWNAIKDLEFDGFVIHVPDALNNAKIPITLEYLDVLKKVMATELSVKDKQRYKISSHGPVHPLVAPIVGNKLPIDSDLMDRAGNLTNPDLGHFHHEGPIQCGSGGRALDLNVLLPDGTVLLCCMDYAMEHILGNLLEIPYEDLFTGPEAKRILAGMDDEEIPLLCRKCLVAKPANKPGSQANGHVVQDNVHDVAVVPAFVQSPSSTQIVPGKKPKIVGLVPGRNEASRLPFCLRALARYADAIVYLDDASEDDSVKVVESLATECRIERILRKDKWHRDEPGDRNKLLAAGREIGGTHFVSVDADEAFTANCADNDFLRKLILNLMPGDQIAVNWIQLWRGVDQFRFDGSVWTWNYIGVIFCDDGQCSYSSEFVHTPRVPGNISGQCYRLPGYTYGLMHFQFVNWRNLLVKQAWYRCLEHVRDPKKPIAAINERYAPSKDETRLGLRVAPASWLSGCTFFDPEAFNQPESWRENQIRAWFKEHGRDYFKGLDIWDLDWSGDVVRMRDEKPVPRPVQGDLSKRAVLFVAKAEACQERNDLRGARLALMRALDWAPDVVDLMLAAGAMHLRAGDARSARWEAVRATISQPDNPVAFLRLAETASALDRAEEFELAIRRVLELLPGDPDALRLLGDFYLKHNRLSDAVACFAKVLEHAPEDVTALLRLGLCHYKNNNLEAARMIYGEVLRLAPDHALARENIDFIEKELNAKIEAGAPSMEPVSRAPLVVPVVTPAPVVSSGKIEVVRSASSGGGEPRVSAIVSTYKSERFIAGCLEDLVGQTLFKHGQLEIVVVDSCSPEGEGAIVKEFQRHHPNIVYIRTDSRETLYAAWNRGIEAASGLYITNSNTDDRHRHDALETMACALDEHSSTELVYGDCYLSTVLNERYEENKKDRIYKYPEFLAPAALLHYQFGPQPMWRKSVHAVVGFFDGSLRAAGDYDFDLRFAQKLTATHLALPLGSYLAHEGAISLADSAMATEKRMVDGRYQQNHVIETLYAKAGVPVGSNAEKALVHLDLGLRALEYFPPWKQGQSEFNAGLAIRSFMRAMRLAPQEPRALNNLFCLLAWLGKSTAALGLLQGRQALASHPTIKVNEALVRRPDFAKSGGRGLTLMPSLLKQLPDQRQLAMITKDEAVAVR
jgi:glycosyltransferase involved in cell wall biosynthesis/Flp pilus assembly protein TadD